MTETDSGFQADIDLDLEKAGILAYFSEFLVSGRPVPPMLWFWRGKDRILGITCRSWEDEADKNAALMEMLFMSPAVQSSTMVLAMAEPIKLIGHIARCVVMITVTVQGALATIAPYTINDEDSTIAFDEDPELDPLGGGAYSEILGHMLGVFARQRRSAFSPSDMVEYLSDNGFEIEFYEGNDMSTISTMRY